MQAVLTRKRAEEFAPDAPTYFSLIRPEFRYDPYPVGIAREVFPVEVYEELVDNWPAMELFQFKEKLGDKYSLSELNHPRQYLDFINGCRPWRRLYDYIKSVGFVNSVIQTLCEHHIDLALMGQPVLTTHAFSPLLHRLLVNIRGRLRRRVGHRGVVRTRFEFSMLPATGGHIKPHTDSPTKLITLVIPIVRPGEWNPAWGGGTAVLRPKDITTNFNYVNHMTEFHLFDTLAEYPYLPNQCLLFVKTFNSHHAVHPMTGTDSTIMRRTLTINIERVVS